MNTLLFTTDLRALNYLTKNMSIIHTKGISKLWIIFAIAFIAIVTASYFLLNSERAIVDTSIELSEGTAKAPAIIMPPSAGVTVNLAATTSASSTTASPSTTTAKLLP